MSQTITHDAIALFPPPQGTSLSRHHQPLVMVRDDLKLLADGGEIPKS